MEEEGILSSPDRSGKRMIIKENNDWNNYWKLFFYLYIYSYSFIIWAILITQMSI
jgi:hypothetical protein